MNRMSYAALAAIAAVAINPSAHAAAFNISLAQDMNIFTAGYSNGGLNSTFSDSFTFLPNIPLALTDISLTNVGTGAKKITFTKIKLDSFDLLPYLVISPSLRYLVVTDLPFSPGLHTLFIEGKSGGNASYGGNVNFTIAAVPEPATWAMMIGGFALAGAAMRRRTAVVGFA